jgi:glyoxylase-like metal-dependent hydrolase (beta-lactamase superfamily II)
MEKIADNFYRITLPIPFRMKHIHVFVLLHKGGVSLFDTGMNSKASLQKLEDALKVLGKTIRDIDRIFITHYHIDHCGMAGRIKEVSGAAILMSEIDGQYIGYQQEGLDTDRLRTVYRQHGLKERNIEAIVRLMGFFRKATVPFHVDHYMKPNETHRVGDRTVEVIPAPGHTRGQVCFFFREEGIFLSADHVLPVITPNLNPDIYHTAFRPLRSFLDSFNPLKELPVCRAYPAHGDPFTDLRARVCELEIHHEERKGRIAAAIREEAKTVFQISEEIFSGGMLDFDLFLAVNETYAHLVELKEEGVVRQIQADNHYLYAAV